MDIFIITGNINVFWNLQTCFTISILYCVFVLSRVYTLITFLFCFSVNVARHIGQKQDFIQHWKRVYFKTSVCQFKLNSFITNICKIRFSLHFLPGLCSRIWLLFERCIDYHTNFYNNVLTSRPTCLKKQQWWYLSHNAFAKYVYNKYLK